MHHHIRLTDMYPTKRFIHDYLYSHCKQQAQVSWFVGRGEIPCVPTLRSPCLRVGGFVPCVDMSSPLIIYMVHWVLLTEYLKLVIYYQHIILFRPRGYILL